MNVHEISEVPIDYDTKHDMHEINSKLSNSFGQLDLVSAIPSGLLTLCHLVVVLVFLLAIWKAYPSTFFW